MIVKQTQDVILRYFSTDLIYPYILQHFDGCRLIYLEHFKDKTKAEQEFNRRTRAETEGKPGDPLEIMTDNERTELIRGKVLRVQCNVYKGVE